MNSVRDVPVTGDILLQQLLKLAFQLSGGSAKAAIQSGEVTVNGQVERRRSRRLAPGDVVEYGGEMVRVVAK